MRAIVVTEYGDRAQTIDVPTPEPRAGQVLITVRAAGMNPMDRDIAAGGWQSFMPATFPMGVTAVNFQLPASTALLERVADALAAGRIVPPPINRISLTQAPAVFGAMRGGKTVIVL